MLGESLAPRRSHITTPTGSIPNAYNGWERLSSPRSMLRYVILLNIHKGIGCKFGVACCCTLTSTADFGKTPSQLFYSSFQGIQ